MPGPTRTRGPDGTEASGGEDRSRTGASSTGAGGGGGLVGLSIRRPVATSMAFLILIVLGLVSFRTLPVDLLPAVEFTQLTVSVNYPNVGPSEIEQIITDRVENVVSGLPNLERVTSESEEGRSRVRLEFGRGTNIDEAANDLRAALDRIREELPVEASSPEIFKLDLDRIEVVGLAVTSTRPLDQVTQIVEKELARRFDQIPGVGSIDLRGGIYREIRIELRRDRLRAAGLTALDVERAVAQENVTLPGGNVKRGFDDLYVRTVGEYQSLEQIENTVVAHVRDQDGDQGGERGARRPIRVRDVAEVVDSYEDVRYLAEVNGMPSIAMGIQKQSGANTVEVSQKIRDEAERINASRDDLHLTVLTDQSDFIRQSIDSVQNAALWGSLLAILVLYAFLRNRSTTAIIGFAIPISVISSFALLYFGGLTLNQMTFGGLALGVGLIVDNSIVVLESIVRKREEEDAEPFEAARVGALEVAGAIVASTLTTCVIFLPVVFTSTTSGALFQALALVVVFALACSLLVALTLVPMLSARFLRLKKPPAGESRFNAFESRYLGWLRWSLQHRGWVFGVTGVLLLAALAVFPTIPVELAPPTDASEIDVEIEMAQGANITLVRKYVQELETKVREVLPPEMVRAVTTEVRGGNAEVELKLVPQDQRSMSSEALADLLRSAVEGKIPGGVVEVDAGSGLWILRRIFSSGGGDGDVQLELRGWDLEQAGQLANQIQKRLETVPGITTVRVSRREGRPEEILDLDRERIGELGLSVEEVARTVQANVGGVEASRLRDGGDEFPIVVRLRPEDRLTGDDLSNVALRTPSGAIVPLAQLVTRRSARGPTEIQRVDGQRVVYVNAGLEEGVALGDAVRRIQSRLADLPMPGGFSILYGGEWVEQQKAQRDFTIAIVMALALVYMLMAAQFERFLDPLIVMVSVPMAMVGVVPTLILTGTTLNIQSIMGLVMLIGIVVNNAIVLVDAINLLRRDRRMGATDAVLEAARLRLRPILMTTCSTVLGLAPLAVGLGAGAEIQAALARVVIGGLVASTLVTLVLIPVTYFTVTGWTARLRRRSWMSQADSDAQTGSRPTSSVDEPAAA